MVRRVPIQTPAATEESQPTLSWLSTPVERCRCCVERPEPFVRLRAGRRRGITRPSAARTVRAAKRLVTLVLLTVISVTTGLAQHEQDHWAFGDHILLSFVGDTVRLDSCPMWAIEGCVSVSDPRTGDLLFYSSGDTIWNRAGQVMAGSWTSPDRSYGDCVQSAVAVPDPADPDRYYLFRNHEDYLTGTVGVRYTLIDMKGDGGNGMVVRDGVAIDGPTTEALVAAKQCDGKGYWVLCRDLYGADVRVLLVSDTGIVETNGGRGISLVPYGNGVVPWYVGSLKVAPNGRLVAMASSSDGRMELFRFDPATGVLSDPIVLEVGDGCSPYLSFSPNSSKLYVSSRSLVQFDVSVHEKSRIQNSRFMIGPYARTMQLHSDGKLYLNLPSYVGRISFPDSSGTACDYDPAWFKLPESMWNPIGLPNFIDALHPCGVVRARLLPGDTLICAGTGLVLRDSSTGPVVSRLWRITGDTSMIDSSRDPGPVYFDRPGTFHISLLVTGSDGFTDADSCTIVVVRRPSIAIEGATSICTGDSVTLTARSALAADWFSGGVEICAGCSALTVSPPSTTTYVARVVNDAGCSAFDTAVVTIVPPPPLDAGPDVRICAGDSASLLASGADTYAWYPADGLSCTECAAPTTSPEGSTTYYVTGMNATGCSAVDSVRVDVTPPPQLAIDSPDSICAGASTVLAAHGAGHYAWWPSTGLSCADCPAPIASPVASTWYFVEGRDSNGCAAVDSVLVDVVAAPVLSGGNVVRICAGDTVQLAFSGGGSYRWTPADGLTCDTCPAPRAFPRTTTRYLVMGTNGFGCRSVDTVTVVVAPRSTGNLAVSAAAALRPGTTARADVSSDAPLQAAVLSVDVWHDPLSCRVDSVTPAPGLSSQWAVSWSRSSDSTSTVRLTADTASTLDPGPLFSLFVRPFLGRSDHTVLSLTNLVVVGGCVDLTGSHTTIALDSVCGLDLRLIELNAGHRSLASPVPNPVSTTATVRFAVPLKGRSWLRIYAADGRMVETILDAVLDPGEHTIDIDATTLPSGRYTLELGQEGWTESVAMMVIRAN